MLVNSSASVAPPLKRPAAFASFTTPSARAPLGMATLPSISTGDSIVAENLSPAWAVLELMDWSSTTEMTVSAGTTSGFGSSDLFTALLADSAADGEELAVASEPPWACWFADFWPWQPAMNKPRNREHTTIEPQRRIIKKPSNFWAGSPSSNILRNTGKSKTRRKECINRVSGPTRCGAVMDFFAAPARAPICGVDCWQSSATRLHECSGTRSPLADRRRYRKGG